MSKASDAGNAVVYTAVKTCDLYRVKVLRMQSRVIWVPGAAGRPRPMFFGKWTDDNGKEHDGGMADLLARPRIMVYNTTMPGTDNNVRAWATVPLWIECKSGKGRMTEDQIHFKNHVEANGEFYLLLHNDMRPLTDWLKQNGIGELGVRHEPSKS